MKGPPSQPRSPVVSMQSTDEDVVKQIASILGVKYYSIGRQKEHWKPAWMVRVIGRRAVNLMKTIRPYMSKRRTAQIDRAISCYKLEIMMTDEEASDTLALLQDFSVKEVSEKTGKNIFTLYDLKKGKTFKHIPR